MIINDSGFKYFERNLERKKKTRIKKKETGCQQEKKERYEAWNNIKDR
jgi:hypothetical protein